MMGDSVRMFGTVTRTCKAIDIDQRVPLRTDLIAPLGKILFKQGVLDAGLLAASFVG